MELGLPNKVTAIVNAPTPPELRSFLGLLKYYHSRLVYHGASSEHATSS